MPGEPVMLLVHSPLLGPASWDALRPHVEAAGWRVAVPDLRPHLDAPSFHAAACAAAADAGRTADVIVGHSRAGPYLPGVATALDRGRARVVFVDAGLPYPGQSWASTMPPDRLAHLRSLARDGRLPRWDTWFTPTVDHTLGDLPELPWAVVDEVLPEPGPGWQRARRGYLRLSAGYRGAAAQAAAAGYAVREHESDHLAIVTQPATVAKLILASLT